MLLPLLQGKGLSGVLSHAVNLLAELRCSESLGAITVVVKLFCLSVHFLHGVVLAPVLQ